MASLELLDALNTGANTVTTVASALGIPRAEASRPWNESWDWLNWQGSREAGGRCRWPVPVAGGRWPVAVTVLHAELEAALAA